MKRVEVEWVDSTAEGGWTDDANVDLAKCSSLGYLIKKDKDKITLAQTISNGIPYYNKFGIPRGCIRSIKEIK